LPVATGSGKAAGKKAAAVAGGRCNFLVGRTVLCPPVFADGHPLPMNAFWFTATAPVLCYAGTVTLSTCTSFSR